MPRPLRLRRSRACNRKAAAEPLPSFMSRPLRLRRRRWLGWDRTSGLLCVRQALCRLSYSPLDPGQGSNPDLHVQSVASFRLDDPGGAPDFSAHPRIDRSPRSGEAGRPFLSRRAQAPNVFFKPLAYPSTLDRLPPSCAQTDGARPTWRGFGARLRRVVSKNEHAKADATCQSAFSLADAPSNLSLSGGASIRSSPCPS